MYPDELRRVVKRHSLESVYLFYGENTYLQEDLIAEIAAALPGAAAEGMNHAVYDAQAHAPVEIVQEARTIPFGAARKLVVVKNVHAFNESQMKPLYRYIESPSRYACLILVMPVSGKNKKDRNRVDAFKKHAAVVVFSNPRPGRDIARFIQQCAKRYGKEIAPDAVSFLAGYRGEDTRRLVSEVEKAALYCGEKKQIETEDVLAVVCAVDTADIFELVKEVGKGNLGASLLSLNRLLETGTPPPVVLSMLSRQFRLLVKAREGAERGDSISQIGSAISLRYENLVQDIVRQAKGWSAETIGAALEDIFRSHTQLRVSRVSSRIVLEQLLYRLVERRAQLPGCIAR